jgi:hypothetical protein
MIRTKRPGGLTDPMARTYSATAASTRRVDQLSLFGDESLLVANLFPLLFGETAARLLAPQMLVPRKMMVMMRRMKVFEAKKYTYLTLALGLAQMAGATLGVFLLLWTGICGWTIAAVMLTGTLTLVSRRIRGEGRMSAIPLKGDADA